MATYQYLRVSTTKQVTERQENIIEKKGYKIDKTFIDKLSGKDTHRPQLQKLKEIAKKGDSIICLSIDRFCRNALDFQELYTFFINKGVRMVFIKEGVDSEGSFSKIILTMSSAFAELEREQITERIQQSADYYKEHGVTTKGKTQWGRAKKTVDDLPKNFKKYYDQMEAGEINKSEMAKLLSITRQGLYKWIKLYREENKTKEENKEDVGDWVVPALTKLVKKIKSNLGINILDKKCGATKINRSITDISIEYTFIYKGTKYLFEYLRNLDKIKMATLDKK